MTTGTDLAVAAAYSAASGSWQDGPGVVYRRPADVLVEASPVPLAGSRVVDVGAGTGPATGAALRAGARTVVAVDAAAGMLAVDAARRPPATVADATALPFPDATFDLALAAFSFTHLQDPAAGFAEARRVVRPGGAVMASAYGDDDRHPVKGIVEQALRDHGWCPDAWHSEVSLDRAPRLSTEEGCEAVVRSAGMEATVRRVRVEHPDVDAGRMVAWRLGMAQNAAFVASLPEAEREELVDEVMGALGDRCPPLVRSVIVITARC